MPSQGPPFSGGLKIDVGRPPGSPGTRRVALPPPTMSRSDGSPSKPALDHWRTPLHPGRVGGPSSVKAVWSQSSRGGHFPEVPLVVELDGRGQESLGHRPVQLDGGGGDRVPQRPNQAPFSTPWGNVPRGACLGRQTPWGTCKPLKKEACC